MIKATRKGHNWHIGHRTRDQPSVRHARLGCANPSLRIVCTYICGLNNYGVNGNKQVKILPNTSNALNATEIKQATVMFDKIGIIFDMNGLVALAFLQ